MLNSLILEKIYNKTFINTKILILLLKCVITMKPIIVYEPGPRMEKIIQNLKGFESLNINPLSSDKSKRIRELRRLPIEIPIIYLWSSGFNHGESFFFDANGIDLKINFDAHDDAETRSSKLGHLYLSHMYHSSKKHNCEVVIFCNQQFHRLTDNGIKLLNGEKFNFIKKISYTVDLDIIHNFPAEESWTWDSEMDLNQLLEILEIAKKRFGGRLMRLDIGGLKLMSRSELTNEELNFAIECYNAVLTKGYNFMIK